MLIQQKLQIEAIVKVGRECFTIGQLFGFPGDFNNSAQLGN
jgi:hypothetical protein